ncbi:MAG: serine/threonine protein kinase [Gemmatimonadota bacterium]|jgi:serine/threonine-protein kinase|nr:serine/threonine protein kinase [Gemmatimonadota bacterium]
MASPTPSDLTGSILAGRYRIIRKLGEGAMGMVYLGEHVKIGRQDAIKVLRGAHANDEEAIARFNRGARNVAAIHHPNVCTIYDYSDTGDGAQFVAMQFIPGESLKELLDREKVLPFDRAVTIAKQTADALQAAHEAGIVHRDLKPANIMVSPDRHGRDLVTVVDFDIAKGSRDGEESEVTRLGFVVGTPEYMSPEQLTGDRLDGRSDIYSLALVLFRMITGSLPFTGTSAQELMIQRLTQEPLQLADVVDGSSFTPELLAGLQGIFDRALARRVTERYADAADFGEQLMAVVENPTWTGSSPAWSPMTSAGSADASPASTGSLARGKSETAGGSTGTGARQSVDGEEEVPLTRVAPAYMTAGSRGIPAARPRSGGNRLLLGGGALVVTAVAVAFVLTRERSPDPVRPPDPPPVVDSTPPPLTGNLRSGTGGIDSSNVLVEVPVNEPPVQPPISSASAVVPPPAPPPAPRAAISVSPADAMDVVFRQLDALGPPVPSRSALTAIRDTAAAVWGLNSASPGDRAMAAYIAGSAWFSLGDAAQCETWINRAIAIRPDGAGYSEMLGNCRRLQ